MIPVSLPRLSLLLEHYKAADTQTEDYSYCSKSQSGYSGDIALIDMISPSCRLISLSVSVWCHLLCVSLTLLPIPSVSHYLLISPHSPSPHLCCRAVQDGR